MWNLRKCSAAALDMLSNSLGDEHILPLLLPIVEARLSDSEWRVRGLLLITLGPCRTNNRVSASLCWVQTT